MKIVLTISMAFVPIIVAASAAAQSGNGAGTRADAMISASAGMAMTEQDAVRAATGASRELTRLMKRAEAKRAFVDYAKFDIRNPEFRLQDISTRYADDNANHRLQAGLRWRLPRLGETDEKTALARWEFSDAKTEAFQYRIRLVREVRRAFFELEYRRKEAVVASKRLSIEERRLDVVTRLVAMGELPLVRKVRARTALSKARRDLAGVSQAVESGMNRLAALTGTENPAGISAGPVPTGKLALQDALALAGETRPEAERAAARAELARSGYRAEKLKMIPFFSTVEVSYHYEREEQDWAELMVGIELPVFNWGGGRLRAAEMAWESRSEAATAGMEEVEQEIADEWASWEAARAAYESIRTQTSGDAMDLKALAAEARRQALSEDDVLEMELADLEMEKMLVEAERDYVLAMTDLCAAVGVDDFAALFAGPAGSGSD